MLCLARATDNQPNPRACQRHIKQPQTFFFTLCLALLSGVHKNLGAIVAACFPNWRAFGQQINLVIVAWGAIGGFGQENNRRFQAFGAMHCHHPNALTFGIHLALYLDVIGFQPDQKAGQTGNLVALKGQGLAEEFVDPVLRFGPKTGQQTAAAIVAC